MPDPDFRVSRHPGICGTLKSKGSTPHKRRGLVACANANERHTNASQFFITLDRAEGLDKKNTIFGKVTGDTIYNLANMNDLEVDDKER